MSYGGRQSSISCPLRHWPNVWPHSTRAARVGRPGGGKRRGRRRQGSRPNWTVSAPWPMPGGSGSDKECPKGTLRGPAPPPTTVIFVVARERPGHLGALRGPAPPPVIAISARGRHPVLLWGGHRQNRTHSECPRPGSLGALRGIVPPPVTVAMPRIIKT